MIKTGSNVKFTYTDACGIRQETSLTLTDNILSPEAMPDYAVCERLTMELRVLPNEKLLNSGIIFAARNLLAVYPEAREIDVKGNAAMNQTSQKIILIVVVVCVLLTLAGLAFASFARKAQKETSDPTPGKPTSSQQTKQETAKKPEATSKKESASKKNSASKKDSTSKNESTPKQETVQEALPETEPVQVHTPAQKPALNINDYVGYWGIRGNQTQELTIHSGGNDSVYFSLWSAAGGNINNAAAQLQDHTASFSVAVDGGVVKGKLTFEKDAVTVQITHSSHSAIPAQVMEFTELSMTSRAYQEEERVPAIDAKPLHLADIIEKASASSEYASDGYAHGPKNLYDGDKTTNWTEGKSGAGIGEYVMLQFDGTYAIKEFTILTGSHYKKDSTYFVKNNRPRAVALCFSDGSSEYIVLDDSREYQVFTFPECYYTDYVKIIIEEVYSGTHWNDTIIAEVDFEAYIP